MKKYVLIMLLVLALSFSTMVSAGNFDEFTNSQENILNLYDVGSETDLYKTAVTSGGAAVLSVDLSEQVQGDYFYSITIVTAGPYIGVEMEIIESDHKMLIVTNIDESRGGTALYADHYQQLLI